jgi:hypothetical protein
MGIVLCIFIFRKQIFAILNKKNVQCYLKKEVDLLLPETGHKIFFYLVNIEVFPQLFHLTYNLFKSDKK